MPVQSSRFEALRRELEKQDYELQRALAELALIEPELCFRIAPDAFAELEAAFTELPTVRSAPWATPCSRA